MIGRSNNYKIINSMGDPQKFPEKIGLNCYETGKCHTAGPDPMGSYGFPSPMFVKMKTMESH